MVKQSKAYDADTVLTIQMSLEFSRVCRLHSIKYPNCKRKSGSAGHFLKEAAKEKLIKLGLSERYVKSLR
jgi:hypothetical protein